MHDVCIAINITLLHWTFLLVACFIIIVVAIFICFYVFYSCMMCVCHIRIKGYLLTYLLNLSSSGYNFPASNQLENLYTFA